MADVTKATSDLKKLEIDSTKQPSSPSSLSPKSPTTPTTPTSPGAAGPGVTRNPSAIKETILTWCKAMCEGYEHVHITNFSSSWADGMAFCALIHHFYPNAFDYSKLNPKNRRGNFKLAFDVADKLAGIAPLLDVEDMIRMKNSPDWKCVFTYVQSIYRRLVILQQKQAQEQQKKDEESEAKKTNEEENKQEAKTAE